MQKALIPPLSDMQKARELVGKTKFAAIEQQAIMELENEDDDVEGDQQDYLTSEIMKKGTRRETNGAADPKVKSINKTLVEDEEKQKFGKPHDTRHSINSEHEEFLHPNMRNSINERDDILKTIY